MKLSVHEHVASTPTQTNSKLCYFERFMCATSSTLVSVWRVNDVHACGSALHVPASPKKNYNNHTACVFLLNTRVLSAVLGLFVFMLKVAEYHIV